MSEGIEAAPRARSSRTRKLSSKMRVFDDYTRNEIKRKKLDALEADDWKVEAVNPDEDDEYNPLDDTATSGDDVTVAVSGSKRGKSKKPKKNKRRDSFLAAAKVKTLADIVDREDYSTYPSWVPNYASIVTAPPTCPPRNFCSVTGLEGKYQCPVTGEYLANLDSYSTHRETRLKGLV